jgi:hypothetical protein
MTREWLGDAIGYNYDGYQGRSQFLPWCWIPRPMFERWAAKHNLPSSPPRFQPDHTATAAVAQPTAPEKLPKAISKRRRPAQERIRQELEKKAPEYIDSHGDKSCWIIAKSLVETRGDARKFDIDAKNKALKRYYANQPKD